MNPVSRASTIAAVYSLNRRRDSPISTRNPSNSTRPNPLPSPRMARPPEKWSSSEKFSATRPGSCHGNTVTIVPSLTRVVCPATQARNCGTFGVSW